LEHGDIRTYTVNAADFGLPSYPISAIEGGEPEYNKSLILDALNGQGPEAHRAAIAMNCSALLVLTGIAADFKQGTEQAMAAMSAGKPIDVIQHAAKVSQENS
jgi:anthranilate phosphoribosyltransferase